MPNLSGRIRSPELRQFYALWRAALIEGPALPRIDTFDGGALAPMCFVAAVEPGGFRFIRFGSRLTGWLGESLEGRLVGDDAPERFGSLAAAYRACREHQTPTYESMRFDFGGGETVSFERVVVPFFAADQSVSHLGGAAMIEDTDVTG
jgi:hypothetical protein